MIIIESRSSVRKALAKARAERIYAEARQGAKGSIESFALIVALSCAFALMMLVFAPAAAQQIAATQVSTPTELIAHAVGLMLGAEGAANAAVFWLGCGVGLSACQRSARKLASERAFVAEVERTKLDQSCALQRMTNTERGIAIDRIDPHAANKLASLRADEAALLRTEALARGIERRLVSTVHSSNSLRARATA